MKKAQIQGYEYIAQFTMSACQLEKFVRFL